jgi:pseudaminic acid cytidylyltransferase
MKLCIIPARGGSKRINKKNIKNFCGKPIIAWSIETVKRHKLFDKVIVSTDNKEIASLAKSFGAETPFARPKKISCDFTQTIDVILHAIKWQIKNEKKPDYVCCIYPTAPFITISDLSYGLKILKKNNYDYVFSATNYAYPIQRSFKLKKKKLVMNYPEFKDSRSQDLEETYHDAGQFYWAATETWLKRRPILGNNSSPIIIPRNRALDIDNIEDWKIAETMFTVINKK